ncbi:Golgi apparatus protein [Nesidiocoris tenuis]|uniref:Golgi apparatus protein n=1 Tax=Nesidiocoris tenuis TaxID=355587 RepID=A0ABN7AAY0_9HEMI|nr:Golgi apparatus protein [Nesidiocoris tenuis]
MDRFKPVLSVIVLYLCSAAVLGTVHENSNSQIAQIANLDSVVVTSRERRDVIGRDASTARSELLVSPECLQLRKMCPRLNFHNSDLDVLECVHQSDQPEDRIDLNEGCRRKVWNLATKLLTYKESLALLKPYCDNERLMAGHVGRCRSVTQPEGLLKCFFENLPSLESKDCANFVSRISFLTFIDSKTMSLYLEDCQKDIVKFNCSSTSAEKKLSCLQNQLETLSKDCQSEVLRLSEIQGEDVKLDRALFRACSEEHRRFCRDQKQTPSEVYECLFLQKNEVVMSAGCLAELLRREKLIAQDYQVSRALVRACKEDIKANRCRKAVSEDRDIRLAQILMCLENATRYGVPTQHPCREEMIKHRRLLLEDYRLSPELVSKCSKDISKFCRKMEPNGKTIHCLMENAKPRRKSKVTPSCLAELENIAEKTDIGEDWRADRVLWKSCASVADVACRSVLDDDTKVMNCLLDKIGTEMMTVDCESSLRTVQYFMARDFKLDPILFKACRVNAADKCGFGSSLTNKALVLPCLYGIIDTLDAGCRKEIRRVMKQRALDVDLHPNIENVCMEDLGSFCSENTDKREEVQCLQNNLEKLKPNCAMAVYNFTELQAEFIELNPIITSNCHEVISQLCRPEQTKNQDYLDCLIEKKNDPLMKAHFKCKAAIEHHQLISLKDYHFTFKFKKACKVYVSWFCPGAKEKAEVVRCLSEQIRNDTFQDQKQHISKDCHQQLRQQLLQQRENVELNTKLKVECSRDISKHCSGVTPGNGRILECLVNNKRDLEDPCRRRIFFVERQELTDSFTDYTLIQACKPMLEKYCQDTTVQPLNCLKKYKYFEDFDFKCREVVVRRMVEQSSDYRFDPNLTKYCRADIRGLCYQVINHNFAEDKEYEGKVIGCLKVNFRRGKLTPMCQKQVVSLLKEAALNYKLNPLLSNVCDKEIKTLCATEETEKIDKGKVEECLKEALLNGQISDVVCRDEIVELINVGKADISADPILNSACADDINDHCTHVDYGAGRKLDCLIDTYQKKTGKLKWQCEKLLKERIEMYKIQPLRRIDNLSELYGSVNSSPAKKYFVVVALTFVGMIFMTGMFCGRTFRRSVATKNK